MEMEKDIIALFLTASVAVLFIFIGLWGLATDSVFLFAVGFLVTPFIIMAGNGISDLVNNY